MGHHQIEDFWKAYKSSDQGTDAPANPCLSEQFGDSPEMADELGTLIVAGIKTATCSALWEYEAEQKPLPSSGTRLIVLDGSNTPLCIIETTEVNICAFSEVDARFAADEGEGDHSLKYWREAHWEFFARSLAKINRQPSENMPLVCERFQVIFHW